MAVLFIPCLYAMAMLVLPAVEPEFGGAKPRHAYVDLDARNVAPETLGALVNVTGNAPLPPVVRSVSLAVLFDSGDALLVRRTDASASTDPLYELKLSAVHAIVWLD